MGMGENIGRVLLIRPCRGELLYTPSFGLIELLSLLPMSTYILGMDELYAPKLWKLFPFCPGPRTICMEELATNLGKEQEMPFSTGRNFPTYGRYQAIQKPKQCLRHCGTHLAGSLSRLGAASAGAFGRTSSSTEDAGRMGKAGPTLVKTNIGLVLEGCYR
jgi:hypothetical protein